MVRVLFAIFVILHGLVHLLYFGQSWRLFELQPGMVWPDGSWLFSRVAGDEVTRALASSGCVLAAVAFVAGVAGLLLRQDWWRPAVVGAALFSSVVYIVFWDGGLRNLDDKGAVGLLLNIAIVVAVLALEWPVLEF